MHSRVCVCTIRSKNIALARAAVSLLFGIYKTIIKKHIVLFSLSPSRSLWWLFCFAHFNTTHNNNTTTTSVFLHSFAGLDVTSIRLLTAFILYLRYNLVYTSLEKLPFSATNPACVCYAFFFSFSTFFTFSLASHFCISNGCTTSDFEKHIR